MLRALPTLFSSLSSRGTNGASPSTPGNMRGLGALLTAHPTLACPLPQPSPPGPQGSLPGCTRLGLTSQTPVSHTGLCLWPLDSGSLGA